MSSPDRRAGAIVVAAGSGTRMGGVRKQFLPLLGRPLLEYSVRAFLQHAEVDRVVVVLTAEDAANPPAWLVALPVTTVSGGRERGDSVLAGLDALPEDADPILIHDGARPLVSAAVIDRVVAAARTGVGAIAAIPVSDTLKSVDAHHRIVSTPDRSNLWQAQTPQGFPSEMIRDAYRRARADLVAATDDAALVERYGGRVHVVLGAPENLKVTRPGDLLVAEALASQIVAG